ERRERDREEYALDRDDDRARLPADIDRAPLLELAEEAPVEAAREDAPRAGEAEPRLRMAATCGARGPEQQPSRDEIVDVEGRVLEVRSAARCLEERQDDAHDPRGRDLESHAHYITESSRAVPCAASAPRQSPSPSPWRALRSWSGPTPRCRP